MQPEVMEGQGLLGQQFPLRFLLIISVPLSLLRVSPLPFLFLLIFLYLSLSSLFLFDPYVLFLLSFPLALTLPSRLSLPISLHLPLPPRFSLPVPLFYPHLPILPLPLPPVLLPPLPIPLPLHPDLPFFLYLSLPPFLFLIYHVLLYLSLHLFSSSSSGHYSYHLQHRVHRRLSPPFFPFRFLILANRGMRRLEEKLWNYA